MTYEKPEIIRQENDEIEIRIGALGKLFASGIGKAFIEVCPITDMKLKATWKHDCYRILLQFCKSTAMTVFS
jgi:hypothetical protein